MTECRHVWVFAGDRHIRCRRCKTRARQEFSPAERAADRQGRWITMPPGRVLDWRHRSTPQAIDPEGARPVREPYDLRADSPRHLTPPPPLPHLSRASLRSVRHWMPAHPDCPYCGDKAELVSNSEIYHGMEYGLWPYAYLCRPCDAYVGLHPNTDLPLGTLANRPLREARKKAKSLFTRYVKGRNLSRREAYQWLSKASGIPPENCHFGHFDLEQCAVAYATVTTAILKETSGA